MELLSSPAEGEGYDWISATASVVAGGFTGQTRLMITFADLKYFRNELRELQKSLKGEAEFNTIEGQIYLKLTTDGLGHINVDGYLMDEAGIGNKLIFEFGIDQTFLKQTLDEIEMCIKTMGK